MLCGGLGRTRNGDNERPPRAMWLRPREFGRASYKKASVSYVGHMSPSVFDSCTFDRSADGIVRQCG
jgi:hypothetical protein